jgi:hypothetical protein
VDHLSRADAVFLHRTQNAAYAHHQRQSQRRRYENLYKLTKYVSVQGKKHFGLPLNNIYSIVTGSLPPAPNYYTIYEMTSSTKFLKEPQAAAVFMFAPKTEIS